MAAPPDETLHHVRNVACDNYIANCRSGLPMDPFAVREAFRAGWEAREAVMRASILDPAIGDIHVRA